MCTVCKRACRVSRVACFVLEQDWRSGQLPPPSDLNGPRVPPFMDNLYNSLSADPSPTATAANNASDPTKSRLAKLKAQRESHADPTFKITSQLYVQSFVFSGGACCVCVSRVLCVCVA